MMKYDIRNSLSFNIKNLKHSLPFAEEMVDERSKLGQGHASCFSQMLKIVKCPFCSFISNIFVFT